MEKPAASTEPQGSRPALGRESVQVPDDQDFRSFRSECEAEVGWNLTYSKAGVSVWVQAVEMDRTLHKIKMVMMVFKTGLLCVALNVVELTMQTRLSLNSEIHLPLPLSAGIKASGERS